MTRIILIFSFLLFAFPAFFTGCQSSGHSQQSTSTDGSEKMNIFLRNELDKPDVISGQRKLYVTIELSTGLTPEINSELAQKGLQIISAPSNLISAAGYANTIKEVAKLPYVISMELDRNLYR